MKHTRNALIISIIALFLCFTMLIGTTFAWLVSEQTNFGNIIRAGKLEIEMAYALPDSAPLAWRDASHGAIFNFDKWEPGHIEERYIKISNVGSLAFDYRLDIIPAAGVHNDVAKYINVYMTVINDIAAFTPPILSTQTPVGTLDDLIRDNDGAARGTLLAEDQYDNNIPSEEIIIYIALKMSDSIPDSYQSVKLGEDEGITLRLLATQADFEKDALGESYDTDAATSNSYTVSDSGELDIVLSQLKDGACADISLDSDIEVSNIKINSAMGDIVINANGNTIRNTATTNARVLNIANCGGNITLTNANLETTQTSGWPSDSRGVALSNDYSGKIITVSNCTINMAADDWSYAVNLNATTQNATIIIEDCTIVGAIALNIWGDNNNFIVKNSTLKTSYDHPEGRYDISVVQLNSEGTDIAENNTVYFESCHFDVVDATPDDDKPFNGDNKVFGITDLGSNNTVTIDDGCTFGERIDEKHSENE